MTRHSFIAPILALALGAGLSTSPALAQSDASSCYATGGGALEICRSVGEPEGVFFAPSSCAFARGVQILRLKTRMAPGPLQVIYHGEPRRETGRRGEACPTDLRATDPGLGGTLRSGRQSDQLATTMPPADYRFWAAQAAQATPPRRQRRRRGRAAREENRQEIRAAAAAEEGSGARDPMAVAGRDWAGDESYALFMIATEATAQGRRHVLIQGRTYDFERVEVRARQDGATDAEWVPFGEEGGRRRSRRSEPPVLAPVLDETGRPIVGNCVAPGFETRGLVGSISVVDQVYHYFYADVLPEDCGAPPAKRRTGLYLRTSRDVGADRAWSAAKLVLDGLPPDTQLRVAKARGMDRWAVGYSCLRPASAAGGPVADLCLHYTADLSVGAISGLGLFSEPVEARRSTAYLGLRSGGDGGGRYGRDGFFWMTDRYGNLDTPAIYPGKGGVLTWFDRLAPRSDGSEGSALYGRPVYWSTWTVRPREVR